MRKKAFLLYKAIKEDKRITTSTHAVGNGEWSIEVHAVDVDNEKEFLFELVGENGTHHHADDLWGMFDNIYNMAEGFLTRKPKVLEDSLPFPPSLNTRRV